MLPAKFVHAVLALLGASCVLPRSQRHGAAGAHALASARRGTPGGFSSNNQTNRPRDKPYFGDVSARNVTAVVGQPAELSCHVKNLGNRTISWIRQRDLHILTSSVYTYTGDERFSALHLEKSDEWKLRIVPALPRDSGIYECQINTEPKLNLAFVLRVEESALVPATCPPNATRRIFESAARAAISPADVHVNRGSTISLVCTVNVQSGPPGSVSWLHGASPVDFDSPRGGISLETEKTENGTTSRLMMTQARLGDSGNYTCVASNADPATATVHVHSNGEHPAAMQHGGTTDNRFASALLLSPLVTGLLLVLLLLLIQQMLGSGNLFSGT